MSDAKNHRDEACNRVSAEQTNARGVIDQLYLKKMESISDKVFSQFGALANEKGISEIPEPERTLIAIYTAQGIIRNGGFAYFFELDFKGNNAYETIINSYKNLGLFEHAQSIERVLALFSGNKPQENFKEREEFIYKYMSGNDEVNYSKEVEDAESIFYKDSEKVYELAYKYALKNV